MHEKLPVGELFIVKQFLCDFFQGRRVKVSLYLQTGIQAVDGTISLRCPPPPRASYLFAPFLPAHHPSP